MSDKNQKPQKPASPPAPRPPQRKVKSERHGPKPKN